MGEDSTLRNLRAELHITHGDPTLKLNTTHKVWLRNSKGEEVIEFEDFDTFIGFFRDLIKLFNKYKDKIRIIRREEE